MEKPKSEETAAETEAEAMKGLEALMRTLVAHYTAARSIVRGMPEEVKKTHAKHAHETWTITTRGLIQEATARFNKETIGKATDANEILALLGAYSAFLSIAGLLGSMNEDQKIALSMTSLHISKFGRGLLEKHAIGELFKNTGTTH